jgi:hypothetical protein
MEDRGTELETTYEKFQEIMEHIFESMPNTPEYRNFRGDFGIWLGQIQYKLMPSNALGLFKKNDIDKIIAAYEAQGGLTYDQLIALFPDSRLQEERQREEQPREPVPFYDKRVTFSVKKPKFIEVFDFKDFYKMYKEYEQQRNIEFLELIKEEFKDILTKTPDVDTSFIPDSDFTPFAKAIGLDPRTIEIIRSNRSDTKFIDSFGFETDYNMYKKFAKKGPPESLELIKEEFKDKLTANPNIDTSFILDTEFTPFAKAIGLEKDVIDSIRSNRFKKTHPRVSAILRYVKGKGGKTKRRKNKKTKRRKNKKTKRRK